MFCYRLDYRTPVLGGIMGAHHSLDLLFLFDNVDRLAGIAYITLLVPHVSHAN
ncbi:hypothetical protein [Streptomyces sp. OE57]|uniref:hypothetical protein n=1 Tax=Streptomyces lacaronensis TaxID=3379885 RepID=UPI0039B78F5E